MVAGLAGALLVLTAPPILAQPVQGEDEVDWYTVEVLVFARDDPAARASEVWPADLPPAALERALELADPEAPPEPEAPGAQAATAEPVEDSPVPAFVLLDNAEFQLGSMAKRLERASLYRPLLHVAWRQPGLGAELARPVHLHSDLRNRYRTATPREERAPEPVDAPSLTSRVFSVFGGSEIEEPVELPPPPTIDGTVRVHRARYLHVEADLRYFSPPPPPSVPARDEPTGPAGNPLFDGAMDFALEEEIPPSLFQLQERRRMRSTEVHYLDHPMFGMLVSITPFELPEPPPEPEPEPAGGAQASPAPPPPPTGETPAPGPAPTPARP